MNAVDARANSPAAARHELSVSDKHCVFRCDRSWFSLPAISVREITIAPELVRVPNCHRSLAGLCHLRSEFIPVLSLTQLISAEDTQSTESHGKLLVINGSSVWAMQIAEAAALESLETLVAPEARMDDLQPTPVTGTAMFREHIVRVLDPMIIYQMAQQSLQSLWRAAANPIRHIHQEQGSQR